MPSTDELVSKTPAHVVLSVVAPAHNESGNIEPLVAEVEPGARAAAEVLSSGGHPSFEFVVVDDGSTDDTADRVRALMSTRPWLRLVRMQDTPPGRGNGQSAAFHAGFRAARGAWIASLDADLQNDPADLPALARALVEHGADLAQGDRSRNRQDNWVKRRGSEVGRLFRRLLLGDHVRDTGCSLRILRRSDAVRLPLEFKGMHRFIPITVVKLGGTIVECEVTHRARHTGETKYGQLGIAKRAIPGLIDCFAVIWMAGRRRPVIGVEEGSSVTAEAKPPAHAAHHPTGAER
ncbi:MAG: glycosyltransferase family 2 protein [Planctomycetota bacterium]